MVWGLFPVDPLSGEESYYLFSKGRYKVGRKGCDIIVNKDKGVSRVHAEIVIDAMVSMDDMNKKLSVKSSKIMIKDSSKYGTFIKKPVGSKQKVSEIPNKETTLDDGDLVSFGTGTATYRLNYVPLVFFLCGLEHSRSNELQEKLSSIGAGMTIKWSHNCTHVLVDDYASLSMNADVVDAIMSKKHFVNHKWIKLLADKHIGTEIPSCSLCAPTLMLQGISVKVADPESRENCLRGYTFLMESLDMYKVKEKLQLLVEAFGAKVVPVGDFIPHSQGLEDDDNNHVVHVINGNGSKCSHNLSSLPKVSEINLICATLSGLLDPVVFVSPAVPVTSSCSTDETVVADSDPEVEIISVDKSAAIHKVESVEVEKEKIFEESISIVHDNKMETINVNDHINITKDDAISDPGNGKSDVIFSQDLIIRDVNLTSSVSCSMGNRVLNFKRFRKMETQSGNSFYNLVPFSKHPYKGSEYENEGVAESLKEEKKRKQREAVAEDLFNNAKVKKRGAAGFLKGLFT